MRDKYIHSLMLTVFLLCVPFVVYPHQFNENTASAAEPAETPLWMPVILQNDSAIITPVSKGKDTADISDKKIGLVLSGGGARGLAHIGLLQAIDKAGLQVDYITGTSMGAILGAMYAAGYSGDTIETIVRNINWDLFFRGSTNLNNIVFEEKHQFGRYAFELPLEDGRLEFASGLIEGQELMLTLSELFHPVYYIKDFNHLDIPFRCVATDLTTGEAIEIDSGEIAMAVRASMAIPSVFTAVNYQGRTLIDGGVSRNFPVRNVRDMGADYVIGSTVATGLRDAEDIKNPIDVIYQMGFFKDAAYYHEDLAMTDMLITPNVKAFSAAAFSNAPSIIDAGQETAKQWQSELNALAEARGDTSGPNENRLPAVREITINDIQVKGLRSDERQFFKNSLTFGTGSKVTGQTINDDVRRIYGTRRYKSINFTLQPEGSHTATLQFNVEPTPPTHIKGGLHFNTQTGASLIANITSRNLLLSHSRASASFNIGEQHRWRLRYDKYSGMGRNYAVGIVSDMENILRPYHEDYSLRQEYYSFYLNAGLRLQRTYETNSGWGFVSLYEFWNLSPRLDSEPSLSGNLRNFRSFAFFEYNTLNQPYFPTSGSRLEVEGGLRYQISTSSEWDRSINEDINVSEMLTFKPYGQIKYKKIFPLSMRYTFQHDLTLSHIQGNDIPYPYLFDIGGLFPLNFNQIPFAGFDAGSVTTSSVVTAQFSLRRQLTSNVSASIIANGGFIDAGEVHWEYWNIEQLISGQALSVNYISRFGPITFSLMHSFHTSSISGYVNIGHYF